MRAVFIPDRSRKHFSTRKVGTRREAEEDAPHWACRFARVSGGFMAFDSQAALDEWLARLRIIAKTRAVTIASCT